MTPIGSGVPASRAAPGGSAAPRRDAATIPQSCTIVLPSSGVFDSRAWRIARSLAARGHAVTIVARLESGLSAEEVHADGYRIIRVPVGAVEGLPGPVRSVLRRSRTGGSRRSDTSVPASSPGPRRSRVRGAIHGVRRLAAIVLTVRSQQVAALDVAPRADLVHAMAYMGIPVGLALGRRDRAPVVYDARDIYVDARNITRLPGFARALFGSMERRWARRASRVMTVNRPYADVMAERFGCRLPAIVLNASYRRSAAASAGACSPLASSGRRASVVVTACWSGSVPRETTAAGVSGSRPAAPRRPVTSTTFLMRRQTPRASILSSSQRPTPTFSCRPTTTSPSQAPWPSTSAGH